MISLVSSLQAEAKRQEGQFETRDEQDPPEPSTRDVSPASGSPVSSAREQGGGTKQQKAPEKEPLREQQKEPLKEQQKEQTWRYAAHSGDKAGWVTGLWAVLWGCCQGKQPSLDEYEWVPSSPGTLTCFDALLCHIHIHAPLLSVCHVFIRGG